MRRARSEQRSGKPADFRKLLLDKKAELAGNLEDTRFDTLARMGRVAEEDQAQVSHEEFISLSRNSMDYTTLRLVEEALDRVRSGEYGVCMECEESISERRLQAVPWTRYCITCQERATELRDDAAVAVGALSNW